MKKIEKIKAMFPMEFEVTQEIIDKGSKRLYDSCNCIGALALKKASGKRNVLWGRTFGYISVGNHIIYIRTKRNVDLMNLKKPKKITFVYYGQNID